MQLRRGSDSDLKQMPRSDSDLKPKVQRGRATSGHFPSIKPEFSSWLVPAHIRVPQPPIKCVLAANSWLRPACIDPAYAHAYKMTGASATVSTLVRISYSRVFLKQESKSSIQEWKSGIVFLSRKGQIRNHFSVQLI